MNAGFDKPLAGFRIQAISAFFFLAVIAILGVTLRYLFVGSIAGVNFKFLMHAHSHAALLGWVHAAICAILIWLFLPEKPGIAYKIQFWGMQVCSLGMLLSFPVQGYGSASIPFSIVHILLSYWFAFCFYFDTRKQAEYRLALRFVHAGLFFLVLGTIGPFSLGPIMAMGLGEKLYYSAIYFYLHFLYNGWFTFAILGILFFLFEKYQVTYDEVKARRFFRLSVAACLPAYALSCLWMKPGAGIYAIGFAAAGAQLIAFFFMYQVMKKAWPIFRQKLSPAIRYLLLLAFFAFAMKLVLQFVSAFPYFADLAYQVRNFIIGYLHLVLLGFVTPFLLGFFQLTGLLRQTSFVRVSLATFFAGFFISELLLFGNSILIWAGLGSIPDFFAILFYVSLLMPAGVISIFISLFTFRPAFEKYQLLPR